MDNSNIGVVYGAVNHDRSVMELSAGDRFRRYGIVTFSELSFPF